jgi:hypothetical protein
MANIIRSAKSGSDWTDNELIAYNIAISSIAPGEFFPVPDPSLDHIDPAILNSPPGTLDPAISDLAAGYLGYLDLAARATQESFIDDFAAETLKLLGFNERGTTISTRYIIPLTICGEADRAAQTDVCLIHRPTIVLLVLVEDKTLSNRTNAEAQVVAEAIAAFQFNNNKRRDYGLNPLDSMTIPCITMSGTRPTFYLVPVTTELSNAVITGQYPTTRTRVLRCATVATHMRRASTGMEDTEYRKLALKRFLAFKVLAKSHWVNVLEGV